MVQMRPDSYPQGTVKGEKLVFKKLQESEGTDSWIALHSLDIFGDIRSGQGEADFVLLIPGKGVLVIEVKSHDEVECRDGSWFLNRQLSERPPHVQASNAMHALRKDLKRLNIDQYKLPFGFCVWFTGASKTRLPLSPEYKQWMFLFADDLAADLKSLLSGIMDNWASHRNLPIGSEKSGVATATSIKECATALRPDFKIRKSAEARVRELQSTLGLALEQQLELMELISGKKQVSIIPGIAGTGKTHIAIAEAKKAHQRGDRTLFVCFNSVLADFLKDELADFAFVEVYSISKYLLEISGLSVPQEAGDDWWKNTLPESAQNAMLNSDGLGKFDTLIVDEAQDLSLEPYLDVLDLSLRKGFGGSQVMFFGDFTHQAVYMRGDEARENLMAKAPMGNEYKLLDINCRNTKQIGDTVMQLIGEPGAYSRYRRTDDGKPPTLVPVKDNEALLNPLKLHLARLEKSFLLDHIVVLSSNKDKLRALLEKADVPITPIGLPKKGKLRWGTSQAFKGMEAPAIVLVEFDEGNAATKETFYVAGTRALSELVCIVPQNLIQTLFGGDK